MNKFNKYNIISIALLSLLVLVGCNNDINNQGNSNITSELSLIDDTGVDSSKIFFDGTWYNKSELSQSTIDYMEMTEDERMLSSYYPPELIKNDTDTDNNDVVDLDHIYEECGVTLRAKNITPTGLTIECNQSNDMILFNQADGLYELNTGSYYIIQKLTDYGFEDIDYKPQEYDIAWTSEAWIILQNSVTEWEVDWEWLYGALEPGRYRIGKEIMKFRGPGDYDKEIIYAHFEIK